MISGVVSDDPVEPLPPEYADARIELMQHDYRKIFGLSYQQILDEPIEIIQLSLMIENMKNKQLQMQNKK